MTETTRTRPYRIRLKSLGRLYSRVIPKITPMRKSSSARTHMLDEVAHAFQSPLTVLLSGLELMENAEPPDRTKIYSAMKTSALDLSRLTQNLLRHARVEEVTIERRSEKFLLSDVLSDIARDIEIVASTKAIAFRSEIPSHIQYVGDIESIKELVVNILHNAVRYTQDSPVREITLSVHVTQESICIRVMDSGVGIPEETLPFVFERFCCVANSIRNQEGCGLGLAIVKRIVDENSGTIAIESTLDHGTTVTIRLPSNALPD